MYRQLPNILTIARMIITILMVFYYLSNVSYKFEILYCAFVIASVSDFFDGYLSRKLNAISNLGRCLDPISDKLLLITALFILVDANFISFIIAFIFVAREMIISGLREFLALEQVNLPVSKLAKWKTVFQLTGIAMCFFENAPGILNLFPGFIIENMSSITNVTLIIAVILTLYTGFIYIFQSRKFLK